jgi:hypothetical protein
MRTKVSKDDSRLAPSKGYIVTSAFSAKPKTPQSGTVSAARKLVRKSLKARNFGFGSLLSSVCSSSGSSPDGSVRYNDPPVIKIDSIENLNMNFSAISALAYGQRNKNVVFSFEHNSASGQDGVEVSPYCKMGIFK